MPIISSPIPVTVTSGDSGAAASSSTLVGTTSDVLDQLKQRNIVYELKFFIKDTNGQWVDFSDKLGLGGVDALKSHPVITHSMEAEFGVFHTSSVKVNLRNGDGLFDDSGARFNELKTVSGQQASFASTVAGQGTALFRKEAKFEAIIKLDDASYEIVPLGIFLIEDITTSTAGGATAQLVGKHKPLMEIDAEKVKDGLDWHRYKPLRYLIPEIVKTAYTKDDDPSEMPASFSVPGVVEIQVPPDASGNDVRTFSYFGRPPDNLVTQESPLKLQWMDQGKVCRSIVFGTVNGITRLWAACDNEIWSFDRETEAWRKHGEIGTDIRYMRLYQGVLYFIGHDDEDFSEEGGQRSFGSTGTFGSYDGSSVSTTGLVGHSSSGRWLWRCGDVDYYEDDGRAFHYQTYHSSIGGLHYRDYSVEGYLQTNEYAHIPFDQVVHSGVAKSSSYTDFLNSPHRSLVKYDAGAASTVEDELPSYTATAELSERVNAGAYSSTQGHVFVTIITNFTAGTGYFAASTYPAFLSVGIVHSEEFVELAVIKITAYQVHTFTQVRSGPGPGRLVIKLKDFEAPEGPAPGVVFVTNTGGNYFETDQGNIYVKGSLNFEPGFGVFIDGLAQPWWSSSWLSGSEYQQYELLDTAFCPVAWVAGGSTKRADALDLVYTLGQFGNYGIYPAAGYNSLPTALSCWVDYSPVDATYPTPDGTKGEVSYKYYLKNTNGDVELLDGFTSLRVGYKSTGEATRSPLHPLCIKGDLYNEEFFLSGTSWMENYSSNSRAFSYRINPDGAAFASTVTTILLPAGGTGVIVSDASSFDQWDVIVIGDGANKEAFQCANIVGSTITLNRPAEIAHASPSNVYLYGKIVRTSEDNLIVDVEFVEDSATYSYIVVELIKANVGTFIPAYAIYGVKSSDYSVDLIRKFQGCPRGLARVEEDDGTIEKFYFIETGSNRLWSIVINGADNFTVNLEDDGFPAVDFEAGLSSNLAFEKIERSGYSDSYAVYGVSYPTVCEAADLPYKPAGKYLLWKYDTFITDRVHMADYSGTKSWDAIKMLAQAFDSIAGFSASGDFFFRVRPFDSSDLSLITVRSDIYDDDVISVIKSSGYAEIYNKAAFTPYRTETEQPELNVTLVPRDKENPNTLNFEDFNLAAFGSDKRQIRLSCVRGGHIPAPTNGHLPLFRYLNFDSIIEVRLAADVTAAQYQSIKLTSVYGGDSSPDGINTGDFIKIKSSDENKGFIERKITDVDNESNDIDIPVGGFGEAFDLDTDVVIVKSFDNGTGVRTDWSDSGVTFVSSDATATKVIPVDNPERVPPGTYVLFQEGDDTVEGGIVVKTSSEDGTITLGVAVTVSEDDIVIAYWAPSVPGRLFAVGDTRVSMSITKSAKLGSPTGPGTVNPLFMAGDTIVVDVPGEVLKSDKQSKQTSYNLTSQNKWGKREYKHNRNNRFLHRRLALAMARVLVEDYKDPHYSFQLTSKWKPFIAFLNTTADLLGIRLVHPKLLPNAFGNEAKGFIKKISHGSGETKISFRDVSPY